MTLVEKLMQLFDERILIHQVEDGEERQILDYNVKFFDIRSTKAKTVWIRTDAQQRKEADILWGRTISGTLP